MLHSMLPVMTGLYPARGTGDTLELDFIIWIQIFRCFVTIMSYDKTKGYLDDDERCLISNEASVTKAVTTVESIYVIKSIAINPPETL